jgi:uncharacterized protein YggU (UPF0235/DUF167 family)
VSLSTVLDIRVTPRASRTIIVGWHYSPRIASERASPTLLVKLATAPVDGAANDALIELLASVLDRPKRAIRIISGGRSRNKRVEIDGLPIEEIARRCNAAIRNR